MFRKQFRQKKSSGTEDLLHMYVSTCMLMCVCMKSQIINHLSLAALLATLAVPEH